MLLLAASVGVVAVETLWAHMIILAKADVAGVA